MVHDRDRGEFTHGKRIFLPVRCDEIEPLLEVLEMLCG